MNKYLLLRRIKAVVKSKGLHVCSAEVVTAVRRACIASKSYFPDEGGFTLDPPLGGLAGADCVGAT
jgi:hypothetical protein